MKHKRIWFKGRIGKEVWREGCQCVWIPPLFTGGSPRHETEKILTKIPVTKQNMESLYISQTEKRYKYYDVK